MSRLNAFERARKNDFKRVLTKTGIWWRWRLLNFGQQVATGMERSNQKASAAMKIVYDEMLDADKERHNGIVKQELTYNK